MSPKIQAAIDAVSKNPLHKNEYDCVAAPALALGMVREGMISASGGKVLEPSRAKLCELAIAEFRKAGFPLASRMENRHDFYRKAAGSVYWLVVSARFASPGIFAASLYQELLDAAEPTFRDQLTRMLKNRNLGSSYAEFLQILGEPQSLLAAEKKTRLQELAANLACGMTSHDASRAISYVRALMG